MSQMYAVKQREKIGGMDLYPGSVVPIPDVFAKSLLERGVVTPIGEDGDKLTNLPSDEGGMASGHVLIKHTAPRPASNA